MQRDKFLDPKDSTALKSRALFGLNNMVSKETHLNEQFINIAER